MYVPTFNLLGLIVPEKSVTKIFNVWKLERKKNEKIKGQIRAAAWFQYTRYIHPFSMCVTSFNLPGLTVPEESVTKNFLVWKLERKKNKGIKGQISRSSLILVHKIHLSIVHVCTMFQPSKPHSSWEKCEEKFQCMKIGEKEKWRNKRTNMQEQPDSGIHHTSVHCSRVYHVSIF